MQPYFKSIPSERKEKHTFKKVSRDPFSMYSVMIITGLP